MVANTVGGASPPKRERVIAKRKTRGGRRRDCPRDRPGAAADPIKATDLSAVQSMVGGTRGRGCRRRPVGGDGVPHVEQMRRQLAVLTEDHLVDEPLRRTMVIDGASPRRRRVLVERPFLVPRRMNKRDRLGF